MLSHNRKLPPIEQVAAEYEAGDTLQKIAERYSMKCLSSISMQLKKAGVQVRKATGENLRINRHKVKPRTGKAHPCYTELPLDMIRAAYESGTSADVLGQQHNTSATTILRKLKAVGVKPRTPGFSRFQRCTDGYMVQSNWERVVDEWLTEHGIAHEVQPPCPWHGKRTARADFRVGDYYVEVWGVEGNAIYDTRKEKKIFQYLQCNALLLQVYPQQIKAGDFTHLAVLLKFAGYGSIISILQQPVSHRR